MSVPLSGRHCTCTCIVYGYLASPSKLLCAGSLNDFAFIGGMYYAASYADSQVTSGAWSLPHPALHMFARISIWALYSFGAGLFGTGLWIIAHECGHQAFSESKSLNNAVGWVLHSAYVQSQSPFLPCDIHYSSSCVTALESPTTHGASLTLNITHLTHT